MAIAKTCPTCGCTAGRQTVVCSDPWHLRRDHLLSIDREAISAREAKARTATTERACAEQEIEIGPDTLRKAADVHSATTIRMRAETARRHFEMALTHFVKWYAPQDLRDRDNFQRDLMMLMRDAMEHKSMTFGMHIDRTESTLHALAMAATSSTRVIFEPKKED